MFVPLGYSLYLHIYRYKMSTASIALHIATFLEFFQIFTCHNAKYLKIHWLFCKLHCHFVIIWWPESENHWLWASGQCILESLHPGKQPAWAVYIYTSFQIRYLNRIAHPVNLSCQIIKYWTYFLCTCSVFQLALLLLEREREKCFI